MAVLIPYHNEGPLLAECLASLAAQTLAVDEILIYDDASALPPDAFVPAGSTVRIVRGTTNAGPAAARNRLLAQATADYVHFHDADDLFTPDWHQRVSNFLITDVDCVLTEVRSLDPAGVVVEGVLGLHALEAEKDLLRFALRNAILTPTTTTRRSLVMRIGGFTEEQWQSEDYEFHVRLALATPSWRAIPDSLITIRIRANSRSQDQLDVWRWAWPAITRLASQLPATHHADLAAFAYRVGHRLVLLGDEKLAGQAFDFARTHGLQRRDLSRGYRALAPVVGLLGAARIAMIYRTILPESLRRRMGWLGAGE